MYKINFLERQQLRDEGGEPITVTKDVVYNESEIEIASCHWKAMGFKRILTVECMPRKNHKGEIIQPKLTPVEIVELFYAPVGKVNGQPYEIQLNEADLKVKAQLLAMYKSGGKPAKAIVPDNPVDDKKVPDPKVDEVVPEWKSSVDAEKKFRKETVYPKLIESGIKFSYNQSTEDLIAKLKFKGIEI